MSLIIVVERDEAQARRVAGALEAEGWLVEVTPTAVDAERVGRGQATDLVVVSEGAEAAAVIERFSTRAGGPGVVVLGAPVAGADGQVDAGASDEALRVGVRRVLSGLSRAAVEKAAAEAASQGGQFTSKDIFGDMLAEVEEEVAGTGMSADAGAKARPAPAPAPSQRPKTKQPAASSSALDRKLEQTLSGVLGSSKPKKRPTKSRPKGDALDDLISKTLSGVVKKAEPKPRTHRAQAPELEVLPEIEIVGPSDPVAPAADVTPPKPEERGVRTGPTQSSADLEVEALVQGLSSKRPSRPSRPKRPEPPVEPPPSAEDVYSTMRMPVMGLPVEPPTQAEPEMPTTVARPPSRDGQGGESALAESKVGSRTEPKTKSKLPSKTAGPEPKIDEEAAETAKRQFGQYTLLDRVAVGGMAEVWKARMKGVEGFQKTVAIKRILPHLTDSSDFLTMFIDEAKLAAQLNHPNIVHIYDLGKIEEDYYIAMEYIAGKDLRSILNDGRHLGKPLPLGLAVMIGSRLASGLDHAHRKRDFDDRDLGLVHRDVSPQNVLVSFDGDIKLCDFGIAKAVAKASKTQMGALKGKLQYMSPEQAWGRVVDARSDIFSLGAVLFEMLTGERLFTGASEISVLESVREGRVRAVREIAGQVSPELDAIVAKALAKDPDDRYQTAGELQQDLEAILYALKPTPVEATLTDYMRSVYGDEANESGDSQEFPPPDDAAIEGTDGAPSVAAVAPKGGTPEEESGRSMGLWIGVAAAVLVLLGVVWFLVAGRSAEAPSATPPTGESPSPSAVVPVTDDLTPAEAGGPAAEGLDPQASGGTEAESDEEPTEAGEDDPSTALTSLVDEQVQAELSQRDEEKRALERQVEEARLAAEQAEEAAAQESAALAEPEPNEEVATVDTSGSSDVAAPTEPESSETGEVPADDATNAAEAPAEAQADPPPEPEPEPELAPQEVKPAEPEPPRYTTGQLVAAGTPGLLAPRLLNIKPPEYPAIARRMKVQGTVVIAALVDETGSVQETKVVQGVRQNVGLNEAAERAARGAKFQPASVDGVRVKTWFNLSIPFRL